MRVGNFHEPYTGVDVTKIPTERQTQSLRRHSDVISLLRIRNVEGDGRSEEEAPDNATTDDEDDFLDRENRSRSRRCACRESRRHRRRRTPRPWQRTGGRDNTEDLNELEESSHDADSNPTSNRRAKRRTRSRIGATGRLQSASNSQGRRAVWPQVESRRGSLRHSRIVLGAGNG